VLVIRPTRYPLPLANIVTYHRLMLSLKCPTDDRWLAQVDKNLNAILIDHAHCERKAAGTAMNLLTAYVENEQLCRDMAEIVNEELEHFHMVLELLKRRGIRFRRLRPCVYARRLHELVRKTEPQRAVDRLLIAGLIEARSCERFSRLRDHVEDSELSDFYGGLFESEARHHATYVRLAHDFGSEDEVPTRLDELATSESDIITSGDDLPRMHS
jgi:tRNA-(ms[2]io[6]A)-hydroxylase